MRVRCILASSDSCRPPHHKETTRDQTSRCSFASTQDRNCQQDKLRIEEYNHKVIHSRRLRPTHVCRKCPLCSHHHIDTLPLSCCKCHSHMLADSLHVRWSRPRFSMTIKKNVPQINWFSARSCKLIPFKFAGASQVPKERSVVMELLKAGNHRSSQSHLMGLPDKLLHGDQQCEINGCRC